MDIISNKEWNESPYKKGWRISYVRDSKLLRLDTKDGYKVFKEQDLIEEIKKLKSI